MSNEGRLVKVHFVGTLDDGTEIVNTHKRGSAHFFMCMNGEMLPGFDEAVKDMEAGETKTIRLEAKDAYGEWKEELVDRVPIEQLPNGDRLMACVGKTVYFNDQNGSFPVKVVSVEDGIVTLDQNNPMAGQAMTFTIELLEVYEPPKPAGTK